MKSSRKDIHRNTHVLPRLRFEDQQLTSFAGLVLFQRLFESLDLRARLRSCFRHLDTTPIFGQATIVLLLVIHLLLGFRDLRHLRYYQDDPLVRRLLGLTKLPDVSTLSRCLSDLDETGVGRLHAVLRDIVLARLATLSLRRITLDFDGSVIGTGRFAEGTAVGFNRKKKGQRSYYPLFCTVAQTGQVLDVLHRSGNVHDSNGAQAFILHCIEQIRTALPGVTVEVRMDSAFFSEAIVGELEQAGVEYTISVPFERYAALKALIDKRSRWQRLDGLCDYFESAWKPKSWSWRRRFVFVRQGVKVQHKEPVQLDLFIPYEHGYAFKVVLTNKTITAAKAVAFHNGRGAQEGVFAELKSDNQMGYVPTRTWLGNRVYLLSALLAHNLARELQMATKAPSRITGQKRPTLWAFERLDTLRRSILQRAGRLIRPQGRLTLSVCANEALQNKLLQYFDGAERAA